MSSPPSTPPSAITLDPSYRLSLGIILLSLPLALVSPWATAVIALFGFFLVIQTATLKLVFTPESLEVYRGEDQIRNFPYHEWLHWEIYTRPVPILFYFREIKSIHFLPILFNPTQLRTCLEGYVGHTPLSVGSPAAMDGAIDGSTAATTDTHHTPSIDPEGELG